MLSINDPIPGWVANTKGEEKAELFVNYFGSPFTRKNADRSPQLEDRYFEHQLDN